MVRNKVKRALREAFWSLRERLPDGHDFVVVARPGVEDLVEREGSPGIESSLAGLLDGSSDESDPETDSGQERLT